MTPNEFIIWLRGFTKAANHYNVTPKQWDFICEELDKVKVEEKQPQKVTRYTLDNTNWGINTTNNIKHD